MTEERKVRWLLLNIVLLMSIALLVWRVFLLRADSGGDSDSCYLCSDASYWFVQAECNHDDDFVNETCEDNCWTVDWGDDWDSCFPDAEFDECDGNWGGQYMMWFKHYQWNGNLQFGCYAYANQYPQSGTIWCGHPCQNVPVYWRCSVDPELCNSGRFITYSPKFMDQHCVCY